jgi:hypothetical protein
MVPAESPPLTREFDPVEHITGTLQAVWDKLCKPFDVSTCLPDFGDLFATVDLDQPAVAAELLVASMLLEIMQNVSRFSVWYRRPARAYGMISIHNPKTNHTDWLLAPEAAQMWAGEIQQLKRLIRRYHGLIQAMVLVDSLVASLPDDPCVSASCLCIPPRTIHLRQSILEKAEITCEACQAPYTC